MTALLEPPPPADAAVRAEGVAYSARLPLLWIPASHSEGSDEENLQLLRAIATLEERGHVSPEPAEGLELEVQRLHDKLDATLNLVACLIRLQQPLPASRTVQITGSALTWQEPADRSAPKDGEGYLQLYLHHCLPQALHLHGHVRCEASGDGTRLHRFELAPLSEALSAAWERHVFRHHRRFIADSRRLEPRPG